MESALAKQHFHEPRNVGDVEDADVVGREGALVCGAALRISLRINDRQRILDAKFKAAGCSFLIASASVLTEQVKKKTTGEAAALAQSCDPVLSEFGLPPAGKEHCAALACEALVSAIRQYSDSVRDEWEGDEALICTCFCVSERTIENEIRVGGLRTIAEVTRACNAGGGCRSCYSLIEDILGEVNGEW